MHSHLSHTPRPFSRGESAVDRPLSAATGPAEAINACHAYVAAMVQPREDGEQPSSDIEAQAGQSEDRRTYSKL